jgi:hypothetical protein
MALDIQETPESRQFTANPASYRYDFLITGEHSDAIVQAYAIAATPVFVSTAMGTLYRQDLQLKPRGWKQWHVTVPYGPMERETGSYTFSFDTTGGTVKIKAAKEHIASYPTDGDPHAGSIGVNTDGTVEGVDVIIPALKLSVQFRHPQGQVTIGFVKSLASVTGTVNSGSFLGFAAGELLFLGASGSDGSNSEAEITYQFAASQNATGLSFGDIASVAKKGHEYAWIEFEDDESSGEAVVVPKSVHVERVYEEVDFAAIFGWS